MHLMVNICGHEAQGNSHKAEVVTELYAMPVGAYKHSNGYPATRKENETFFNLFIIFYDEKIFGHKAQGNGHAAEVVPEMYAMPVGAYKHRDGNPATKKRKLNVLILII